MSNDIMGSAYCPWYVIQHETNRSVPISEKIYQDAMDASFDSITYPITTTQFQNTVFRAVKEFTAKANTLSVTDRLSTSSSLAYGPVVPPFTIGDTLLQPIEAVSLAVITTSQWIDLASPDPLVFNVSLQVFNQEIAYAGFCGASNVLIRAPPLHHGNIPCGNGMIKFARILVEALDNFPYLTFSVLFPFSDDANAIGTSVSPSDRSELGSLSQFERSAYVSYTGTGDDMPKQIQYGGNFGTWEAWNTIRNICKYNSRLGAALYMPDSVLASPVRSRWLCEPVRMLVLRQECFVNNVRNQPVLSKSVQEYLITFTQKKSAPFIILSDLKPPSTHEKYDRETNKRGSNVEAVNANLELGQRSKERVAKDPRPHLSYLRYLQNGLPAASQVELFSAGYQDYLQLPLQPLADNLECVTYEVFERDPIKYIWYERAITSTLRRWSEGRMLGSSPDGAVVVCVVGAGRGPLVTRSIRAASTVGISIDLWAIEKNPNAFLVLQQHNEERWGDSVKLVKTDMRSWPGPCWKLNGKDGEESFKYGLVDVFVSELLGSFGDNELSPECLDGVQHLLNPVNGISIPSSYQSLLTPITAPKLHLDLVARSSENSKTSETPYVVMLHSFDYLSTCEPKVGRASEEAKNMKNLAVKRTNIGRHGCLTKPKPVMGICWKFEHPVAREILERGKNRHMGGAGGITGGYGQNEHNTRFAQLTFPCHDAGVCHGLAGYFEAVLFKSPGDENGSYEDDSEGSEDSEDKEDCCYDEAFCNNKLDMTVELSTNPVNMKKKCKGMTSWFPMYFPIKKPLYCPANSEIQVSIWRMTDDRKVWYEWFIEVYLIVEKWNIESKKGSCKESRSSTGLVGGKNTESHWPDERMSDFTVKDSIYGNDEMMNNVGKSGTEEGFEEVKGKFQDELKGGKGSTEGENRMKVKGVSEANKEIKGYESDKCDIIKETIKQRIRVASSDIMSSRNSACMM